MEEGGRVVRRREGPYLSMAGRLGWPNLEELIELAMSIEVHLMARFCPNCQSE
jgi:hypothetical protein